MREHFSKDSAAYPITDKSSETVAAAIMNWIVHFCPPRILHCDNGAEFKGAVLLLMRQHGIQVILFKLFIILEAKCRLTGDEREVTTPTKIRTHRTSKRPFRG